MPRLADHSAVTGGNAHQRAGGIAVRAVDQLLGVPHHGTWQDVTQQLYQAPHLHPRIAQHAEDQHQCRKKSQNNKVRGIGGVEGNMHLLDSLGGVHNFADQAALGNSFIVSPTLDKSARSPKGCGQIRFRVILPFPCYSAEIR